jgi:NAD(P) transhydrogenase
MTDVEIEPTTNGAPKVVSEPARHDLDVIVIGSGPGGQRAAIQAAKLGKRVAVVERRERVGDVSIHTGTVPSKTLRQAILEDIANRGNRLRDLC